MVLVIYLILRYAFNKYYNNATIRKQFRAPLFFFNGDSEGIRCRWSARPTITTTSVRLLELIQKYSGCGRVWIFSSSRLVFKTLSCTNICEHPCICSIDMLRLAPSMVFVCIQCIYVSNKFNKSLLLHHVVSVWPLVDDVNPDFFITHLAINYFASWLHTTSLWSFPKKLWTKELPVNIPALLLAISSKSWTTSRIRGEVNSLS